MRVEHPEVKHTLDEYEIVFESGMVVPVTVNLDLGDTYEEGPDVILVSLVAKPSLTDPTKTLPAEDIRIFKSKVASINHRTREVVEATPEVKEDFRKLIVELTGSNSIN